MNNKTAECPNCFEEFNVTHSPFCSNHCEDVFCDNAPTKLIDAVYTEFKAMEL